MAWQGQAGPEDAGGGGGHVGGVEATVSMDTSPLAADMARVNDMLTQLEGKFTTAGAGAAAATARIDAGMAGVGKSANAAGFRLQAFAQSLDDMQYVGEQGLRPILNNLVQISPALGIAAIGFEAIRKHQDGLAEAARAVGDAWGVTGERGEASFRNVATSIEAVTQGLREAKRWVDDLVEGYGDLTGATKRAQEEAVGKFLVGDNPLNRARGGLVTGAIDAYGRDRFVDEATRRAAETDATLRNPTPDRVREEQTRLIGLYDAAKRGDLGAIFGLQRRTAGTGVGAAIGEALANTPAERQRMADEDRFEREGVERAREDQRERQERQDRALQDQDVAADRGDARTKAAFARVEQLRGVNRLREAGNEEGLDRFRSLQSIADRLNQPDVRSSQIMDSAQINASVQRSISNDDPMRRMLEEARRSNLNLGQIRQLLDRFNQPVKVGNR